MTSLSDRISALKDEIAQIRQTINNIREEKSASFLRDEARVQKYTTLTDFNLQQRRTLKGHYGKIYGLHWATDSRHLVSVSQDGKLIKWNALTASRDMVIPLRSPWAVTCAFAPSGHFLAAGGMGGACSVYRVVEPSNEPILESRVLHRELLPGAPPPSPTSLSSSSSSAAPASLPLTSPSSSSSSSSSSSNDHPAASVSRSSSAATLATVHSHTDSSSPSHSTFAVGCRFLDNHALAVAYSDGHGAVWDVEGRVVHAWFAGHQHHGQQHWHQPVQPSSVAGGSSSNRNMWISSAVAMMMTSSSISSAATAAATAHVTPDDNSGGMRDYFHIVTSSSSSSASFGGGSHVTTASMGARSTSPHPFTHSGMSRSSVSTPSSSTVLSPSFSASIGGVSLSPFSPASTTSLFSSLPSPSSSSPHLHSSSSSTVLFPPRCDTLAMAIVEPNSATVSASPVPHLIATGGADAVARVWDTRVWGARPARTFVGHESDINAMCFASSDGMLLVSGSDDGTARLYDLRAARQLNQYTPPEKAFDSSSSSATSSPSSASGASLTSSSPSTFSSSPPSMFFGRSAYGYPSHVSSVALSSSGRVVFAGYDDCVCRAYDLIDGTLLQELRNHDGNLSALGVAVDGRVMCTGSWDSLLRIWA